MEKRRLINAPIVEAILGIKLGNPVSEEHLNRVLEQEYFQNYSKRDQTREFRVDFDASQKAVQSNHVNKGYRLTDVNNTNVVFIETDRLALSILPPYTSGDVLLTQYQNIWNRYIEGCNLQNLADIGLRYVNKFEINISDFEENVKLNPQFSIGRINDTPKSSLTRIASSSQKYKAESLIHFVVTPVEHDKYSIILDIDTHEFNIDYRSFDSVSDTWTRLRDYKNEIFFSILPNAENMKEFK